MLTRFAAVIRENLTTLTDARDFEPMFFRKFPEMTDDAMELLMDAESRDVIEGVVRALSERPDGDDISSGDAFGDAFGDVLKAAGKELGVSGRRLYGPIRAALTGMTSGPELDKIAAFIGTGLVRKRLERALTLPKP
jgi:glutamyl/glutaminyl-tRNA synthetase